MRCGKPSLPGQMRYALSVSCGISYLSWPFFWITPLASPSPQTKFLWPPVPPTPGSIMHKQHIVQGGMKNMMNTFCLDPPGGNSASRCCIFSLFASFLSVYNLSLVTTNSRWMLVDHQKNRCWVLKLSHFTSWWILWGQLASTRYIDKHKSAEFVFIKEKLKKKIGKLDIQIMGYEENKAPLAKVKSQKKPMQMFAPNKYQFTH